MHSDCAGKACSAEAGKYRCRHYGDFVSSRAQHCSKQEKSSHQHIGQAVRVQRVGSITDIDPVLFKCKVNLLAVVGGLGDRANGFC